MENFTRPLTAVARNDEPVSSALLLTIEEAAVALTIGKTKMYELIKTGDVPARYIGRRRVIAVVDLRRYIDALPTESAVEEDPR